MGNESNFCDLRRAAVEASLFFRIAIGILVLSGAIVVDAALAAVLTVLALACCVGVVKAEKRKCRYDALIQDLLDSHADQLAKVVPMAEALKEVVEVLGSRGIHVDECDLRCWCEKNDVRTAPENLIIERRRARYRAQAEKAAAMDRVFDSQS